MSISERLRDRGYDICICFDDLIESISNNMINAGDTINNKNNSENSVHTNSNNVSL